MLNLSTKTVKELRQSGYRVRVLHSRHVKQDNGEITKFVPLMDIQNRSKCFPRGGLTKIELTTPDNKEYKGQAGCVISDAFCYRRGVSIALGKLEEVEKGN